MMRDAVGADNWSVDGRFWGKERGLKRPYPVVCHLLDTAAVCLVLWDRLLGSGFRGRLAAALGLAEEEARTVVAFWAGLHDLGKISPPFQAQVPSAFAAVRDTPSYVFAPGADKERAFRHEMATHWALSVLLDEAGYPGATRPRRAVSHQVAQLLGGHHGCFGGVLRARELAAGSAYQHGLGEEGWAGQRRAHFEELRRVIGAQAVPAGGLPSELAVVVTGLVVVSDWLASQVEAVASLLPPVGWRAAPEALDAHWERSRAAAPDLVRRARLGRARFAAQEFGDMFPFSPNPLQQDLVEHLPGLVAERGSGLLLVTAPAGDGKTEAALFAASVLGRSAEARGLYFALPTMATTDGMFPRVERFAREALEGERALTLLHSMAWLSPVYAGPAQEAAGAGAVSAEGGTATEAGAWLRGPKRGLLAPLAAGTIDRALAAVLPLRYNALRLFGLSDKVFVVDEAHAYGPWMHSLLTRLLEWLGVFGAPVVLLSATLTGRTAGSLVDAYRRGAGFREASRIEPVYPGWLFTDAGSGRVSSPRETGSGRERVLDVSLRRVEWDSSEAPEVAVRAGGRREVLRETLAVVAREGGTALVCCTTVAEAQLTFRDLRVAFPELAGRVGGLRLLHSRYPAGVRQKITAECEAAYGKPLSAGDTDRPRPASILVATQVVEQSLDFDFELIVSNLAPLAQLLQRAGRGRRHERGRSGRPGWAWPEDRPRMVVLEPVDENGDIEVPRGWGTVYDRGLLRRTAFLLHEEDGRGIKVPGDVQRLVDDVYAPDFVDRLDAAAKQELVRMDAEREAQEMAETHMAAVVSICSPADVAGDLSRLSELQPGVTEELLTTRLGADTGRVLCLYEQPGGQLALDEDGGMPLAVLERSSGLSVDEVSVVMARVAPAPGSWLRGGEGHPLPEGWEEHSALGDLVLLCMARELRGGRWVCRHGNRTISISPVGLETI
ncbi:CRISPR-associated helicase Cas3' [Streptomyces sp. NPDC006195]|uniref:CRISPR-associated helicase Cas3' n=1 Tax=unclassified Streptomyces TaxID=2593676 RepID=UPI0033AB9401